MAKPNIADTRKLSGDQITEQVNATRRELFEHPPFQGSPHQAGPPVHGATGAETLRHPG
jgi:hypothetical protein